MYAVKVLDFGLAKAMEPTARSSPSMSMAPTITTPAVTQAGMILGTAAYMSPEQARGHSVDRRVDIWAFGAVLYEMLTGRRPFDGDDSVTVIASALKDEVNWDALPTDAPSAVKRLLRRCLEKDPKRRLSAMADARLELDDAMAAARAGPVCLLRHRAGALDAAVMSPLPGERSPLAVERARLQPGQSVAAARCPSAWRAGP